MLVRTLLSRIQQDKGVFLKGPHGFEPLVALYHPCMLGVMRHALKERRLSLQSVIWECLEEGLAVEVPMSSDDEAALINLNRPEDWERLDLRRAQGNEGDGLSPVGT
jgi:molybdopterin-guanine dinucleotide biosynthesis protein A